MSCLFTFSYCSWDLKARILKCLPFFSPVDHILPDLSTMTCLSWVAPHGMVSFNELDKAVVHVIRLASFLSLCFQCVCSLMPSLSPYHLPWVYLDLGYLFMAAPAKCSCCLFPWMWGISSQPPLLILDRVISSQPLLHRAAAAPIYTMSSLFIHLLMDTKLLPYLVCCKQCCFEH